MSCVVITDHAMTRYKERTSLPKRRIEKDAEQAWKNGVRFDEVSGALRRYIDGQHFTSKMFGEIRIYCGRVYVFKRGAVIKSGGIKNDDMSTLITIFDLPEKYRRKGTEYRIRNGRKRGENKQ